MSSPRDQKMAPLVVRLYNQMRSRVIALQAPARSQVGVQARYNVLRIDRYLPVDLIPGARQARPCS
jgi:NADH:ubiquinone oxidoreductase subunit B-like Fe-S oxidoreductase